MKYFVGTELGIADLLQRRFDWRNALWTEGISDVCNPEKVVLILGDKDHVVNVEVSLTHFASSSQQDTALTFEFPSA